MSLGDKWLRFCVRIDMWKNEAIKWWVVSVFWAAALYLIVHSLAFYLTWVASL